MRFDRLVFYGGVFSEKESFFTNVPRSLIAPYELTHVRASPPATVRLAERRAGKVLYQIDSVYSPPPPSPTQRVWARTP